MGSNTVVRAFQIFGLFLTLVLFFVAYNWTGDLVADHQANEAFFLHQARVVTSDDKIEEILTGKVPEESYKYTYGSSEFILHSYGRDVKLDKHSRIVLISEFSNAIFTRDMNRVIFMPRFSWEELIDVFEPIE